MFSDCDIFLETGVANGFSSCYILLAFRKKNRGKLISIDGIFNHGNLKNK